MIQFDPYPRFPRPVGAKQFLGWFSDLVVGPSDFWWGELHGAARIFRVDENSSGDGDPFGLPEDAVSYRGALSKAESMKLPQLAEIRSIDAQIAVLLQRRANLAKECER